MAIEEKYGIVISNYNELEKKILEIALNSMVYSNINYPAFFEERQCLNIHLINLLTAVRLYIDQLSQNVRGCMPNSKNPKESIKKLLSIEYTNNKDYRFMEALRNHVQHRGILVHSTKINRRRTTLKDNYFLEYNIDFFSYRSFLEEDPTFKKQVLEELDEEINLKISVRSYIESISNIQEATRNLISKYVSEARESIKAAHSKYEAVYKDSLVGLTAFKLSGDKKVSSVPLLLEWDDIRIKLLERNKKLINLKKRYVTNKINYSNK